MNEQIKFKDIFKYSPIPSYTWQKVESDLILIDYNIAAEKKNNRQIENYLGIKASELYKDQPEFIKILHRCINDRVPIFRELKYKYNSRGKIKYLSIKSGFVPPDLVIIHIEDITELRKAERKLKESKEKYHKAYNLSEFYKDLFAHDVGNILQNVLSSVELCSVYLNVNYKQKEIDEIFKIIKDQVKRGAKLITNARKLSTIESGKDTIKKINAYQVLKDSLKFVKKYFQKSTIDIRVDTPSTELYVKADNLLLDVFENILVNAVKHNENLNIDVLVRMSKEQIKGRNYIKIEFIDNGLGIANVRKNEIFQREIEIEKSVSGIRIGLSLVKRIIESYNGKIWVEDRIKGDYSKGSNFILLIPEVD